MAHVSRRDRMFVQENILEPDA